MSLRARVWGVSLIALGVLILLFSEIFLVSFVAILMIVLGFFILAISILKWIWPH